MNRGDAPHANSRRLCSGAAVELFLREQGLGSYSLTPQEAAQASQTPDINGRCFTKTFGGNPVHERPNLPDGNIVLVNPQVQIYAPDSLGKPGLLFLTSNTIPIEFTRETFHIFLTVSGPISMVNRHRYLGTYTRVPILRTTLGVDEWSALPPSVSNLDFCVHRWGTLSCLMPCKYRHRLASRIHCLYSPDGRVLHARVSLRRRHGREPSLDEIEEWLKVNTERRQGISQAAVTAAFNSGEEKMEFEVVRCVGYDVNIARKMQDVVTQPV
ncbi:hypothetical protein BJV78DRAFT_1195128 [Lactifluus subvellereus]|nr:hypothetical protein BJV78DRAFT_1195128 [Lactifluus subvellereus]